MFKKKNIENINNHDEVIFEKSHNIQSKNKTQLNNNVLHDIEMIESFSQSSNTVSSLFVKNLYFDNSVMYMNDILSTPIYDENILYQRQKFFSSYNSKKNEEYFQDILKRLSSVKWLFTKKDKDVEQLLQTVYFSWWIFKYANSSSLSLTTKNIYYILLSPTIGIMSPIIYFILPYLILKYKFKFNIPFKTYIKTLYHVSTANLYSTNEGSNLLKTISYLSYISSIVFYFQGIMQSIDTSKHTLLIIRIITNHMNNIYMIYNSYTNLYNTFSSNPFYKLENIHIDDFNTSTTHKPVLLSNFGLRLKHYKEIGNYVSLLDEMMKQVFIFDTLHSISLTIKQLQLYPTSYDFNTKIPYTHFKQLWHICLHENPVKNSFSNKCSNRNTIITGPNAAGKSTFIKSVLINVMLSQTITFCAAEESIITPFEYIGSQINIPDSTGHESLFEAEMYRCKYNIDYVRTNENRKVILFMDEIFNSTNVVEGISGAYSILKHLADCTNCILYVTTHFPYLTKLHKNSSFNLYKFDCSKNTNNAICYNYKISKGVSKQYVALDILKYNHFNEDIIDLANSIKEEILSCV